MAPGEVIQFDESGVHGRRYWQRSVAGKAHASPSLDAFDKIFRAAVARQTDVEVDFGVFLSGGIDSSLVSAVARSLYPQRSLKAFTLRFQEQSFDEGEFAESMARDLKMDLVTVWVKPEDVRDGLKSLLGLVGEPLADPAWVPAALLARRAAEDVKMALVGEGADELFGGYPTYLGAGLADKVGRLPGWLRRLIRRAVEALPPTDKKVTVSFLLKRFVSGMDLDGLARHQSWISNIPAPLLQRLTGDRFESAPPKMRTVACWINCNNGIWKTRLAEGLLTKADRSSMSSSLELRAPFLDQAVMEFSQSRCCRNWKIDRPTIRDEGFSQKLPPCGIYREASCIGASAGCRCRSRPGCAGRCARGPKRTLPAGSWSGWESGPPPPRICWPNICPAGPIMGVRCGH